MEKSPESSFLINLGALALSVATLVGAYALGLRKPSELFIVILVSALVFTVLLENIFLPESATLRHLKIRRPMSMKRVLFRLVALLVTLGAIGLLYWTLPLYTTKSFKVDYFPFLGFFAPVLLVLAIPYFMIMDRIDPEEEDVLCRLGRAICTFKKTLTRFELANYVRIWAVKAFYLALMQPSAIEKITVFVQYNFNRLSQGPTEVYLFANTLLYGLDIVFAASGYVLNFKLFNTHTRTAEPTLSGWVAALACYWPFWGVLFSPYFFNYQSPILWDQFCATGGFVWWIWASAIVACEAVYAAATITAGIRFSNLTYRGLWRTGPYRWMKHPAYFFKNLSWWLISVPFLAHSGTHAIKATLLLLGVNALYYWRAKTEERHLSRYPEYVAYANELKRRSIFSRFGRGEDS